MGHGMIVLATLNVFFYRLRFYSMLNHHLLCFSYYPVGRKIEERLLGENQGIEVGIDSETLCAVSEHFLNS